MDQLQGGMCTPAGGWGGSQVSLTQGDDDSSDRQDSSEDDPGGAQRVVVFREEKKQTPELCGDFETFFC